MLFRCCSEWIYSSAHWSQEKQNRHCIDSAETRHGSWCHYTGKRVFGIVHSNGRAETSTSGLCVPSFLWCVHAFSDKSTAESLVSLRLPYTFRGVSHPKWCSASGLNCRYQNPQNQIKAFRACYQTILVPSCTFLVRIGGISGEFGRAMVRSLARRSLAKIPIVGPNELDIYVKGSKKARLRIYRTQIRPSDHDIAWYQVSDLISIQHIRTVDMASSIGWLRIWAR